MAGEFAKLLPFSWRGVHLPLSRIQVTLAHDLVAHKYWGVDGARVEDTGVAPLRISATIPISNAIEPSQREKWTAGALYPNALRAFLTAFGKRSIGELQHPEFGVINCKAEQCEFTHSGSRQDATEIQASWIETIADDATVQLGVTTTPAHAAQAIAKRGEDLRGLAPKLPVLTEDVASFGRKLRAFPDALSVSGYRALGVINELLYQATALQQSVDRARNVRLCPVTQAVQAVTTICHDLRKQELNSGGFGVYIVPADTTLGGVTQALPNGTDIGKLARMNPSLLRTPVVAKGTSVRYPLAA